MSTPAWLGELEARMGASQIRTDAADLWAYGYDNSRRHTSPAAVVFATDHQHVVDIVRLCNRHRLPLVARGRGTGTAGAAVPIAGGIVLSLERMERIVRIDPDNRAMVVEPGVTNQAVQNAAAAHGFFWPPDPTSAAYCTVGGNLACNSAGPRAVKYGTTRDNTLALQLVTGAGETVRTGVYTTKGVVGYDLTRLIIGSEGTLAIITQATLKLTPRPLASRLLRAVYADMRGAAAAVARVMAQPVTPCALEFIDGRAIAMVREYASCELPEDAGAMLMVEADGSPATLDEAEAALRIALAGPGLVELRSAHTAAEAQALWATRKALSPALRKVAPKKINEDVVVPVSHLAEFMTILDQLSHRHAITLVNFGHAGNGNIHVNLLVDPDDPAQMRAAHACLNDIFTAVLRLGGTLSGEHGIGLEKRDYVPRELESHAIELMRGIKRVFDPMGILNPGKGFFTP